MSLRLTLESEIKNEFKRRVHEEGISRILKCLSNLKEDQVWQKPNPNLNSIGNLILHLEGNVNQWILSTLGSFEDQRKRGTEFDVNSRVSKKVLIDKLSVLKNRTKEVIDTLTNEQLCKIYNVQCYQETGVSILIHVIEHFSYHVGQITFYSKYLLDVDLGYYTGQSLDKTN